MDIIWRRLIFVYQQNENVFKQTISVFGFVKILFEITLCSEIMEFPLKLLRIISIETRIYTNDV